MDITACYIVKNEADKLMQSLQTVRAAGITKAVVVDTGSTDGSKEAAAAWGAECHDFAWCDDFAAARNFALQWICSRWVLFLDADEYLEKPSEWIPYIKNLERDHPKTEAVFSKRVEYDSVQKWKNQETMVIRLFRGDAGLRYRGRIHEILYCPKGEMQIITENHALKIVHTGYETGVAESKILRNLKILKELVDQEGMDAWKRYYLCQCSFGLRDFHKAYQYADEALKEPSPLFQGHKDLFHWKIESMRQLNLPLSEMLQTAEKAIREYPEMPEFYGERGMILCGMGEFTQAEDSFLMALERFYAPSFEEVTGSYFTESVETQLLERMLQIAVIQRLPASEQMYLKLLMKHSESRDKWRHSYQEHCHKVENMLPRGLKALYDRWKENYDAGDLLFLLHELRLLQKQQQVINEPMDQETHFAPEKLLASMESLAQDKYHMGKFQQVYRQMIGIPMADRIEMLNVIYSQEEIDFLTDQLAHFPVDKVWLYYARRSTNGIDPMLMQLLRLPADQRVEWLDGVQKLLVWMIFFLADDGGRDLLPEEQANLPDEAKRLWNLRKRIGPVQKSVHVIGDRAPRVSIMIPTYNMPELFFRTLRSARRQQYPNLEILVCDNSTDDRTQEGMREFTGDTRIRYIRNQQAKSKAENFAPFADLAEGDYLQWLMQDDILAPDKVLKMAEDLIRHPEVTLVTSQRGFIDRDGYALSDPMRVDFGIRGEKERFSGEILGRQMLMYGANLIGEPPAVLFRRKDLQHHYWRADVRGYTTISDVVMWLELLEKGPCIIYREPLSWYRRHLAQEGQQSAVLLRSRQEWLQLIQEYYRKKCFLHTPQEYRNAFPIFIKEYQGTFRPLRETVTQAEWRAYENSIRKMQKELEME